MYERFGKGDEVPERPEVPDCAAHVLGWFYELSSRRAPSMGGVSPLQFGDIAAWQALLGVQVLPEEVRMILAMDVAFRQAANEANSKPKPKEGQPPKGLFKA